MLKFSVCISSIRVPSLKATIDSIRCQTWQNWELIVVGQGADLRLQAIGEAAAREDRRIQYFHLRQYGATLARNFALQIATGDIIALTDDDCEAQADWLEVLAGYFLAEPEVGLVGGALVAPPPIRRGLAFCPSVYPAEVLYDPVASNRLEPPGWGWACGNVAIRRQVIARVGEFDEYLGPGAIFPASDDNDYRLRLEALGIKMRTTSRAVVYHSFGYRYGPRSVFGLLRGYAMANGGLDAKLTLLGDPRGQESFQKTYQECTLDLFRNSRLHRLPNSLGRLWYYTRAYRRCLREYRVDPLRKVLYPVTSYVPVRVANPNRGQL
jgi:glycosyltransferase involved in cell wall biosynthesis